MSDPLRNFLDKTKPNFQKDGAWSKYFPLFDVFENLFYSSSRKTSGITHVRDGSDIQRVMAIVWMATFPTMFFGMYNLGSHSLEYLDSINQQNTGDWHHYLVSIVGYDSNNFFSKLFLKR